jgi:hypothetical protein
MNRKKWYKYIALVFLFATIFACKSKNNKDISDFISSWQNKEILFPENLVFTHYAEDTVEYKIPDDEYKIIVYVNPSDCTGCTLQLAAWKYFLTYIDSAFNRNIPCLFFANPPQILDLIILLERGEWETPVCVDNNNEFAILNKIPVNPSFQTFLLNEQNRVVVIGNPIQNVEIAKLYIKQITEKDNT